MTSSEFSASCSGTNGSNWKRQNRTSGEGIWTKSITAGLPLTLEKLRRRSHTYAIAYHSSDLMVVPHMIWRLLVTTWHWSSVRHRYDNCESLSILGSTAYILIDKQHRKKLDSKSVWYLSNMNQDQEPGLSFVENEHTASHDVKNKTRIETHRNTASDWKDRIATSKRR